MDNTPIPPPQDTDTQAGDRPLSVKRYLHRFDRSQPSLLVVRTYETAGGERYSRVTREPWAGL